MSRLSGMRPRRVTLSAILAILTAACARTPPRELPPFPTRSGDFVILPTKSLDAPASVSETEPLVMRLHTAEAEPCSYVSSSWRLVTGQVTIVPFGTRNRNPECAKSVVTIPARVSPRGRLAEYDVEVPMPLRVVVCQPWGDPMVRYVIIRQVGRRGTDVARLLAQRDSMNAAAASGQALQLDASSCASSMMGSALSG
jgi:hypothetical protein